MKDFLSKISEKVFDRVLQLAFWIILGFVAITIGIPLLGDVLVMFYNNIKDYVIDAPAAEQVTLGFLGLF